MERTKDGQTRLATDKLFVSYPRELPTYFFHRLILQNQKGMIKNV